MSEEFAIKLVKYLQQNDKIIDALIAEMKQNFAEEEYKPLLLKFAHILALESDIGDLIGNKFPNLHPFKGGSQH
jgi:hypothetical protein